MQPPSKHPFGRIRRLLRQRNLWALDPKDADATPTRHQPPAATRREPSAATRDEPRVTSPDEQSATLPNDPPASLQDTALTPAIPPATTRDGATAKFRRRVKEKRRERGLPVSSDEEESEEEPGVVVLHKMGHRKITLHPGNVAVKSGKHIPPGEAEALRVAAQAGVPVPRVHGVDKTPDGKHRIRMDFVQGQPLDHLWPSMSPDQKKDMARQLRGILDLMRSVPPPPDLIGACDGTGIRETRVYFSHSAPAARDEHGFNEYLMSGIADCAPRLIRDAFAQRLRTNHRIVLTHCDLSPRNIMVHEGKIKALVDWEDAGWYPEYWEYVKFFYRTGSGAGDWWHYAGDIFSQTYHDELVDYVALLKWQSP